jgi:4-hydroxymandelate oxidase
MTDRTVADLLDRGRAALPEDLAGHIAAGAGDESTIDANRRAIERHRLVHSMAQGVGTPDLTTPFFGASLTMPVFTAPMGPMELVDPGGAAAVARGAHTAGIGTMPAITAAPRFEDVAAVGAPTLAQFYWWGDRLWLAGMVERVERAGCIGIAVTVDVPAYGKRRRDLHSGFDHHGQMALPNLVDAPTDRASRIAHGRSITLSDLEWFCSLTELPVIIKGVLSGRDARHVIEIGADAVYVSNHGGRALGGQVGTVDVLAEIVDEVDDRVPVIVDGGFASAEDICVALALGADLVALGRPVAWALAADGAEGVAHLANLLHEDLTTALTVLGASTPSALTRDHIRTV